MLRTLRAMASVLSILVAAPQLAGAQVAVLDSANTREFFERHYAGCFAPTYYLPAGEEYQRYFRGWEYVLQTTGVAYDIVQDADVTAEGLAGYRLLILSNTAGVSVAQARAIHQWVIRGGRLLATFGSGYKGIGFDPRQADRLKLQKGGTFGLHQLWGDPMSKAFGSGGATDILVTRYEGPTAPLEGLLPGGVLGYGGLANLLVRRPDPFRSVLAWVLMEGGTTPYPAIVERRAAHGRVVYFAFAPEYIVSKEFALPLTIACDDGQDWSGRSEDLRRLMSSTITYLLEH